MRFHPGFLAAVIGLALLAPTAAMADHRHHHHDDARYNFSFNYGSPYYYGGGYYRPYAHGWHGPRFGPTFYYEVPVIREYEVTRIVEPTPQISGPPPAQNWYLCEDSGEYYPYVTECDSDWKLVPATPRR